MQMLPLPPKAKPGDTVLIRTSDGESIIGKLEKDLDKPLSCVLRMGPDGRVCEVNGSYVVRREVLTIGEA